MNFGPQTAEADSHRRSWTGRIEHGINFFDTANVYGWGAEQGPHRGDHRPLVRPGRRPPGEDRAGDQGVRRDGATGPTTAGCPRATSAAPARRRCGGCRPTTSTCTRCTTSTGTPRGRRSGRPWRPWSPRARCSTSARPTSPAGTSRRPRRPHRAALARAGQRAVALQPADPRGRAGGAAGAPSVRPRRDPVEPAARRPARRRAAQGAARAAGAEGPAAERWRSTATAVEAYEELCGELGEEPADVALAWLLHPAGGDRADHRAAHVCPAPVRPAGGHAGPGRVHARASRRAFPWPRYRTRGLCMVTDSAPLKATQARPRRREARVPRERGSDGCARPQGQPATRSGH